MFSERFQILISPQQRRRLEQEARARGSSVASLVREAIDARFGPSDREARVRAAEEIAAMRSGTELTPEEIEEVLAAERAGAAPELDSRRG